MRPTQPKKAKRPNLMLQLTDEEDRGKPDMREVTKAASGAIVTVEDGLSSEESKVKPR